MGTTDILAKKIRECQNGQPQAFAWLLSCYGQRLYGFFVRATGSQNDADDLLQELFVKLLKSIKYYKHDDRFEPWLFRIAANMVRDRGRKRQRSKIVPLENSSENQVNLAETLQSNEPLPDKSIQQAEWNDQLQKALGRLPELDRQAIIMRHYGQLSFKEIAKELQIPMGTALAKVHRGLKSLRQILESYRNEE